MAGAPLFYNQHEWLTVFLRNAGSREMAVVGDPTPVVFKHVIPSGFDCLVHGITMVMVGALAMRADQFGSKGGELTNGILLDMRDPDGVIIRDFLDGETIVRNGDFSLFSGEDTNILGGERGISVHWDWSDNLDGSFILMPSGYSFNATIQDDLTSDVITLSMKMLGVLRRQR